MTPSDIRALAARVETEEPTEELRAAVLDAFGSEAEWLTAPNPLVSVDDAKAFQPEGWAPIIALSETGVWRGTLSRTHGQSVRARANDLARMWTAANLRALAWEMEHADG